MKALLKSLTVIIINVKIVTSMKNFDTSSSWYGQVSIKLLSWLNLKVIQDFNIHTVLSSSEQQWLIGAIVVQECYKWNIDKAYLQLQINIDKHAQCIHQIVIWWICCFNNLQTSWAYCQKHNYNCIQMKVFVCGLHPDTLHARTCMLIPHHSSCKV